MATIHVGPSGYSFKDWLGMVYPTEMKSRDSLLHYADFIEPSRNGDYPPMLRNKEDVERHAEAKLALIA